MHKVLLVMVLFSFLLGYVAYYFLQCLRERSPLPGRRFSLLDLLIVTTWIAVVLGLVRYAVR